MRNTKKDLEIGLKMNRFKKLNFQEQKLSRAFWLALHVDISTFFIFINLTKSKV